MRSTPDPNARAALEPRQSVVDPVPPQWLKRAVIAGAAAGLLCALWLLPPGRPTVVPLSRPAVQTNAVDPSAPALEPARPVDAARSDNTPTDPEAAVLNLLESNLAALSAAAPHAQTNTPPAPAPAPHRESATADPTDPDADAWITVRMRVTAYCACPICCGDNSDGYTACMHKIRPGDTFVAADKRYPFGTEMIIPGYNAGRPVYVKDRGRLITGNRLDVFFDSHQRAREWGVRYLDVKIKRP